MPEFSAGYSGGGVVRASPVSGSTSTGVAVTTGGTAHTKGSWVELIASTEFDANWIEIDIVAAPNQQHLFDIGIGAAASEQVIIPNLLAQSLSIEQPNGPYLFPVFIPAGSRLAARGQSGQASSACFVSVRLIAGIGLSAGSGPSFVSTYGAVPASSTGTNVDPGATANTDSSWVQLAAATDRDHRWLVLACLGYVGATSPAAKWRVSVGIGAATEAVLIPDIHLADTYLSVVLVRKFPVFVPRGSRLTVKIRCSDINDNTRDLWVIAYGAG